MAAIYSRNGKWRCQIRRLGQPNIGKTFTKKADALQWARQIESEIERGLFLDIKEAQTTTLSTLLDRYEREILPTKKSRRAVKYQIKLINGELGHLTLSAVTPAKLASFRDDRLQDVRN